MNEKLQQIFIELTLKAEQVSDNTTLLVSLFRLMIRLHYFGLFSQILTLFLVGGVCAGRDQVDTNRVL